MPVEKLANILGAETVRKIYEDGASGAVQETGKVATDLIKALRLFTAPLQFAAAYQDRLVKYLDKVRSNVPEERQMEAPPSIAGPIIERLRYQEDNNYLTQLYLNLLSRAIDKERIQEAHPGFIHVIDQLSPDEAYLLYFLSKEAVLYRYSNHYKPGTSCTIILQKPVALKVVPEIPSVSMKFFSMYVAHLSNLSLIEIQLIAIEQIYERPQDELIGIDSQTQIMLTEFGKLFVKACIPPNGFIIIGGEGK